MNVDTAMAGHHWRYGGHSPEPNEVGVCVAIGPDGRICGRACNRVGSTGRLRHNPKPYGRSMKYGRREL